MMFSFNYQFDCFLLFVAVLILRVVIIPPFLALIESDDGISGTPIPRYPGASLIEIGVPPRIAAFLAASAIFPPDTAGLLGPIGTYCGGVMSFWLEGVGTFCSDGGTRPVSFARINGCFSAAGDVIGGFFVAGRTIGGSGFL
jgi:hypothetical protein